MRLIHPRNNRPFTESHEAVFSTQLYTMAYDLQSHANSKEDLCTNVQSYLHQEGTRRGVIQLHALS